MRQLLWIAAAFAFANPAQCFAWGAMGHQVIAHIAAGELTPAARTQVEQLLGGDAEHAMVEASTWADGVRAQRPDTAPWHFVRIPVGSGGYDAMRDCTRDNCVVAQIEHDRRILSNRSLQQSVRAQALRFLIHFVGDVHQPLRAADNKDREGTGLRVVVGRRRTNMLAVWDTDLVGILGRNGENVARNLEDEIRQSRDRPWQFGDAATWANESFRIAVQEIYSSSTNRNSSTPVILPREYGAIEENIVKTHIEKAGLRLAWVLNETFQ